MPKGTLLLIPVLAGMIVLSACSDAGDTADVEVAEPAPAQADSDRVTP